MAALTRIRNNQVYNSDIDASTKIVPGSITGGLFAPAITYTGNLTVSNLFVYGNVSSLDTVSVISSDPTIILNRNFSGSNTYDVGLILGRGNQTNTALVWNESNKEFAFMYTSATTAVSYYGTVPNSGYANVHANGGLFSNLSATSINTTNLLSSNARISNGYLDNTVIGANTANSAAFTTLSATGTANFAGTINANTLNALNIGNTGANFTGTLNGPVNGPLNGSIGATTPNTGSFTTLLTSGTANFANVLTAANITATTIGNASTVLTGINLTVAGTITAATVTALTIGNAATSLNASSVAIANSLTANTLNALNIGNTGAILTGTHNGPLNGPHNGTVGEIAPNSVVATSVTTTSGGQITGYLTGPIGANTANSGVFTTLTATSGYQGAVNGPFNGTIGAITPNSVVATSVTTTSGGQLTGYHTGPIGANTANSGVFTTVTTVSGGQITGYLTGPIGANTANTGVFTTLTATSGYQGAVNGALNGTLGATTPNSAAVTTLTASDTTNATGLQTGALQVTNGGASIQKDLWVGGNIYGNITSQVSTILGINDPLIYLNASNPQNYNYEIGLYSHMYTGAGNVYGHTGIVRNHVDNVWYLFSNVPEPSAGVVNLASPNLILDGMKMGTLVVANNTPSTTTTTGALQVSGGTGIAGNLNVGGIINGAFNGTVGATTTSTGAFTTLTTSSTINSTGTIYAVNGVQGPLDGPFNGTVGAVTPNTGVFTSVTTVGGGQLKGYHTGAIGANIANTGAFTTVIASGNIFANSGTVSTSTTTGALVVNGGVGASGNLNVGDFNSSLHNIQGNLLLGQGSVQNSADSILTINQSSSTPVVSNATIHVSGANNKSTFITIDSFGTSQTSGYAGRLARGTTNAPSNVMAGDVLTAFSGRGYGATGYYGNGNAAPSMRIIAAEDYTDTSQAANISFFVTASGQVDTGPPAVTISSIGTLHANRPTASAGLTTGAIIANGGVAVVGTLNVGNGINLFGNGNIIASTTSANLFNTPTTVSAFGNASSLLMGGNTGILMINNPTIVGSLPTQNLFNANATTINFAGAATVLNIGGLTGVTTVNNGVYVANIADATSAYYAGLITAGGIAVAKSANISGNIYSGSTGTFAGNLSAPNIIGTISISSPIARTNVVNAYANANISINPSANGNLVVNENSLVANLVVNGNTVKNLLVTNGATGQVGIKVSPELIPNYTSFQVNANDSMMIPVGLTGQRPVAGMEQKGMLRFNSSSNLMEYWDGTNWNSGGAVFTLITADEFVGNGSQNVFTLSQNTTTNGVIVSVNGLVQIPSVAYTVTGKILTFTSAPAVSAYIDVRTIVTTVSVTSIADGTTSVSLSNAQPSIYATVQDSNVWVANTSTYFSGGISAFNSNTSLTQNTLTTVDTFSKTKFRSAKYVVTVSDFAGAKYQTAEVLVVHNGTTATAAAYSIVSTSGSSFVTYGAVVSGSNVLLQANCTSATSYASVQQIYNAV